MKTKSESGKNSSGEAFTLGRKGFARISAVEGVQMTASMDADFRSFDRKALPSKKRRQMLVEKYGKAP